MAYSDSISNTVFSANAVVDTAYRRCRLPAQAITAEMQSYALKALYLLLSQLASVKTPSWCIEQIILPFYENQPIVTLPRGTVEVLNANYRTIQPVTGVNTVLSESITTSFTTSTTVSTVGIEWAGDSVPLTFQVSTNGSVWVTVGSSDAVASAGEITWTDITPATAYPYFRITADDPIEYEVLTLGNMPQEIPLGVLNRDQYVDQNNKVFPGRPNSYWFQRDLPEPVMNIWPAPNLSAEAAQLIVWRHRHIMDTQNLRQDIEVPQRWLDAVIDGLANKVGPETPSVALEWLPVLAAKWEQSKQMAFDGDNDNSSTFIQPNISVYTK